MALNTENIRLDACRIFFGGEELGCTSGGIEVEVTTETTQVKVDQYGETVVNEIIRGRNLSVKAPLSETTAENLARIMPGSTLYDDGVKATGNVAFSGQPSADDTITINGTVFTFKASGATGNQINIGASASATIDNAVGVLNASTVAGVALATYSKNVGNTQLVVTYDERGTAGNAFTLAKNGTNLSVSGATLSGGTNTTKKKVNVSTGIGTSLLKTAKEMRLHPVSLALNDVSEDLTIPLTQTPGAMQFAYKTGDQRIFNCTFMAYPDANGLLYIWGDPSAV